MSEPAEEGGTRPSRLPAAVISLGLVSFFTDAASEMIVPLLPAFLASLGASGTFIGLIDGIADSTAAFGKLWSGIAADRARRRKPLVVLGYGLATLVRPLVALALAPWHVLAVRFLDRVGKGIRTSPRDALLADVTPVARRGAAFGLHRAMDHAGAVVGALVGWALLSLAGVSVRWVFAAAVVPGVISMLVLLVGVREPATRAAVAASASPHARPGLPPQLRRYLVLTALFALACSSDAFLLLRAVDLGVPVATVPLLWALLHVAKAGLAAPLGALADRVGRRLTVAVGWGLYALVYVGFALASSTTTIVVLFAVYGVHYALIEGAEKAVVADLAPSDARGRAFGAFHFVTGLATLPASIGFGVAWDVWGPPVALGGAAAAAALAAALMPILVGVGPSTSSRR